MLLLGANCPMRDYLAEATQPWFGRCSVRCALAAGAGSAALGAAGEARSMRTSPVPRRSGTNVSPQASLRRASFCLDQMQGRVGDVAIERPGHASTNLLGVRTGAVALDVRNDAAVAVEATVGSSDWAHLCALLEAERREVLPRGRAKRLTSLRRVDLSKAHLQCLRRRAGARVAASRERVAICDANNGAEQ
jgi:hypothetical protein